MTQADPVSDHRVAALQAAKAEFERVIAGRKNFSVREARYLRRLARRRTKPELPESSLTAEEAAWRVVYDALDKQLAEAFGAEAKRELDDAEQSQDTFQQLGASVERSMRTNRGRKDISLAMFLSILVGGFIVLVLTGWRWWTATLTAVIAAVLSLFITATALESFWSTQILGVYLYRFGKLFNSTSMKDAGTRLYRRATGLDEFERRYENHEDLEQAVKDARETLTQLRGHIQADFDMLFKSGAFRNRLDVLEQAMLNAEHPAQTRVEAAQSILNLTKTLSDSGFEPLLQFRDELDGQLVDLSHFIARIGSPEKQRKISHWQELARDLFYALSTQVNLLHARLEWDEMIPRHVIEYEGDITQKLPSQFAIEMAEGAETFKHAAEEENRLARQLDVVNSELFGYLYS